MGIMGAVFIMTVNFARNATIAATVLRTRKICSKPSGDFTETLYGESSHGGENAHFRM
jgi:hypothetical protein